MAGTHEEEHRRRAYHLWLQEGRPSGEDRRHSELAAREVSDKGSRPLGLDEMSMEEAGQQSDAMLEKLRRHP
jgi:hypothetical protein